MTSDEIARALSEQAHELAMEQREAFIEETERQEIEAAARARRRLERKQARKGNRT